MVVKNKNLTLSIKDSTIEYGDIGAAFYTDDVQSAFITFYLNKEGYNLDLDSYSDFYLDLSLSDNTVWKNEKLEIINSKKGAIRYIIPNDIIGHAGRVSASLFLKSNNVIFRAVNFTFEIRDSGTVSKTLQVLSMPFLSDTVRELIENNSVNLLDNALKDRIVSSSVDYVANNPTKFKGEKGDKGDKGATGATGAKGATGPAGKDGVIPNTDNWQKFKLTNDDGTYQMTSLASSLDALRALKPGNYYTTSTPITGASSTAGFTTVEWRNDSTVKFITFKPYNSQQIYVMRYYNTWSDWEKVSFDESNLAGVQKSKLTNDDGTTFVYENFDFSNQESALSKSNGLYYIKNGVNYNENSLPSPLGYLQIMKTYTTGTSAMLIYTPMGSNYNNNTDIYISKKSGSWSTWKKINISQTDTGWVPFQLINGAQSNTSYKGTGENGFDCSYRTVVNGSITTRYLRLNGSNLSHGQTIAKLPSDFCKNTQTFYMKTDIDHANLMVKIVPSGDVSIYFPKATQSSIQPSHDIYGVVSWID